MSPIFFCNVGWMSRYEGLAGKPDKIVGGGKWVADNKRGNEVCNFLPANDGYVYGHVETIKGKLDREINISPLASDAEDHVDGVDVVWTATNPDGSGRKVVGWYRNATVFRRRQPFEKAPSKQHALDGIETYRIRTLARNVVCIELDDRNLTLGRGSGWMGHTPWWTPKPGAAPEITHFVARLRRIIGRSTTSLPQKPQKGHPAGNGGAAKDPYSRYVQAYEAEISPRHHQLQDRFERFISAAGAIELKPNVRSVDLRYRDTSKRLVLAEVKPCDDKNARFAIRTAIGQLLDYRQRCAEEARLLVVIERVPTPSDQSLAVSNGFGIAHPAGSGFKIIWPDMEVNQRCL